MSGHGGEVEPIEYTEFFKNKSSRVWNTLFMVVLLPFLAIPWLQEQVVEDWNEGDESGGGGGHH